MSNLNQLAWIVALIGALGVGEARAQGTNPSAPAPKVTVEKAEMKAVADSSTYTGRIQAINQVDLLARVAGFVEKINFKEGAPVSSGDVLIQIEPDAYQAAITQIQGQIKSAEAAKKLADIDLDRQQKLLAKGDVAESVVQRSEANQGQADGQLQQLKGSLQSAQLDLSYTNIAAPFDGRVGFRNVSTGAFVGPETGTLVSLSSIDPIHVQFAVAEAELLDFRKKRAQNSGAGPVAIQLTLANGDTYSHPGKIDVIDTQVQSGTDTVLVRAVFPNPDGVLIDQQFVRVTLVDDAQEKSLVIPAKALQRDQAGYFVLMVGSDNTVEKTAIAVDRVQGADAIVSKGLKEGDGVITDGLQRVHAGLVVDPVPAASPTTPGDGGGTDQSAAPKE